MKQELLDLIRAARAREHRLVSGSGDEPADPGGRWSARDHVAHLSWWRAKNAAATIEAIRAGTRPPPRPDDDEQNASIYAATKDLPAAQIKKDAEASWEALRRAVEACSEEDLQKAHPDADGFHLWELVPAHAGHVATHLMWWDLENGDERQAEAAALWGYEADAGAFADPLKRADGTYNLACFYARAGRAQEAIRLLGESFEAKPALKDLARHDPDLEGIRKELAPILS